jgi:hypothetical protein
VTTVATTVSNQGRLSAGATSPRYHSASKARDALWFRERINAYLAGRGVNPIRARMARAA